MRVLVTGAAGRVGAATCEALLARGHNVVGYDLRSVQIAYDRFAAITGSLEDAPALHQACTDVDVVLHLGAFMSWDPRDQARVFSSNVTGTLNTLAAAAGNEVDRFVFASTGEVYPDRNPAYLPIDEQHPRLPTSSYGLSKLMAEQAVDFYQRCHKLETVILRFSHTQDATELLDPHSFFSGPRFYLEAKIRQQRDLGHSAAVRMLESLDTGAEKLVVSCDESGRPYRMGICDTRDTVQGILQAMTSDVAVGEAINLGPPSAVSFEEAAAQLQQATGLDVVRVNLPGPAVYYDTNIEKARRLLRFEPEWTFAAMVEDGLSRRFADAV